MAVDVSCGTRPDHCGRCGRLWLSLWRLETWEHWLGGEGGLEGGKLGGWEGLGYGLGKDYLVAGLFDWLYG